MIYKDCPQYHICYPELGSSLKEVCGPCPKNPKNPHAKDNIGTRLKQFRNESGLNQGEFSSLLEISQGTLSSLEANVSLPSSETFVRLVSKTNIDIVWLLTGGSKCSKGIIQKESYRYLSDKELGDRCFKIMAILKDMHIGQAIDTLDDTKSLIKDLNTVNLNHPLFMEAFGASCQDPSE